MEQVRNMVAARVLALAGLAMKREDFSEEELRYIDASSRGCTSIATRAAAQSYAVEEVLRRREVSDLRTRLTQAEAERDALRRAWREIDLYAAIHRGAASVNKLPRLSIHDIRQMAASIRHAMEDAITATSAPEGGEEQDG